jgi:hypothetical protein
MLSKFLVIAVIFLGPNSALAGETMRPGDIKATFFNGQAFTAATPNGIRFKMTFTPDGKATREPVEPFGTPKTGTWSLNPNGFCTSWEGAKASCFSLVPIGENRWSVQRVATTIAVTVAIWSK